MNIYRGSSDCADNANYINCCCNSCCPSMIAGPTGATGATAMDCSIPLVLVAPM